MTDYYQVIERVRVGGEWQGREWPDDIAGSVDSAYREICRWTNSDPGYTERDGAWYVVMSDDWVLSIIPVE